jgi:hypothetical protein
MKIIRSRLSPLFDQYSNNENRLTHALLHTVSSSNWIFSRFLKQFAKIDHTITAKTFEITTQKVPLEHGDKDPEKVESIPDAWIVDDCSEIGLAIEVKDVKNSVSIKQLEGHTKRVINYNFPHLIVITPDLQPPDKLLKFRETRKESVIVIWQSWDAVYRWLKELSNKANNRDKDEFIITSMLEYLERRRKVLGFQGIFFRSGFNVHEAKEILYAEMESIQTSFNKVFPELTRRRPSITTISQESVWDCFGNDKGFTSDIHFTFSIRETFHDISMTIPNSANRTWTHLKRVFSSNELEGELFKILEILRKKVPYLYVEFIQRHFKYRRFGIRDGFMEFDIDTLGPPFRAKKSEAKELPVWKQALKEAITNKKNVNAQVMFKSRFYYKETKGIIDKPGFIKTADSTAKAFKSLYNFLSDF